ncbi:MAG: proline--tRNA ligase [Gammaproteobacteria bacterium]
MRASALGLFTVKETPSEAELVSHRLMLRAGLIRMVAAGIYTWLPLGLKVLRRVEQAVRLEMERAGAVELLMPAIQPAELWQESGRWTKYGPELLRLSDRHERPFCFGPTHEEVITDLIRREVHSYRQLPLTFFQIQTKFRDEIRPRFGVMRAREFVMKDAYSFHDSEASLRIGYERMRDAYIRIFERLGLSARAVAADSGAIGGRISHEFHVLADAGEDRLALSDGSDYAANVELAEAPPHTGPRTGASRPLTHETLPPDGPAGRIGRDLARTVRIDILERADGEPLAVALRADHELNPVKAAKRLGSANLLPRQKIRERFGCDPTSLGPVGLNIPLVADHAAAELSDFASGANADGQYLSGTNWGRDCPEPERLDLRLVTEGDPSPDGAGRLHLVRGIEVGHIFQLGTEYSERMNARFRDEAGGETCFWMGCYGIGVSRIVAAAVEQHHDALGIVWPLPLAPFDFAIAPIGGNASERVFEVSRDLENRLEEEHRPVLFDDRGLRPGAMFADLDLIGIPHRLVVSERGLSRGVIEWRERKTQKMEEIPLDSICEILAQKAPPSA